jgi:hypothetical protein
MGLSGFDMKPWHKFWIKSFSVFVASITVSKGVSTVAGQIQLLDGLAILWPGVVGLATYWGGVADSTPAPWNAQTKETP